MILVWQDYAYRIILRAIYPIKKYGGGWGTEKFSASPHNIFHMFQLVLFPLQHISILLLILISSLMHCSAPPWEVL